MNDSLFIEKIFELFINPQGTRTYDTEAFLYKFNANNRIYSIIFANRDSVKWDSIFNYLKQFDDLRHLAFRNTNFEQFHLLTLLPSINNLELEASRIDGKQRFSRMPNLTRLNLSQTPNINVDIISNCPNVEYLNISSCNLTNESLNTLCGMNLTNLRQLNMKNNAISDINSISFIPNLTILELGKNDVHNIHPLENLPRLEYLDLVSNGIDDISVLTKLENLVHVNLTNNLISDLSVIDQLIKKGNIKGIYLFSNKITAISETFFIHLFNLEHNEIMARDLKNCVVLHQRYETAARLRDIERMFINTGIAAAKYEEMYTAYIQLLYQTNKVNSPPYEIVEQGIDTVLRFFNNLKSDGLDYIYEAKLTLVGHGSAGKTSLQKRLVDEYAPLPFEETRTRGIAIHDWIFQASTGAEGTAHIWDFGGQDVYYPVHRFFITENSVFVLIASTRQNQHNFDYWIPTIFQFGNSSPIILVQNCHDGNKVVWNDLGEYLGNTHFNLIRTGGLPYTEMNLNNNNEGLDRLRKSIIMQLESLPGFGKGILKSWLVVRHELYEIAKNKSCMSFDDFALLCLSKESSAFNTTNDIIDFARFLHEIGVVLWYSENQFLSRWIILVPEWSMNAVYRIIDDETIQNRRGTIIAEDFTRLWCDSTYNDHGNILREMLTIFKIAFPKKHARTDYILPARLMSLPYEAKWQVQPSDLRLEYRYSFMPRGIVNQMSAELSRYIAADTEVWNNAVNLATAETTAQCQVIEDTYNRTINIRARGRDARALVVLVMDALRNINEGYKGLKHEIFVPCSCATCSIAVNPTFFLYDKLIQYSNERQDAIVYCNDGGISIGIEDLLFRVGLHGSTKKQAHSDMVRSKTSALKLFIAYSKHDEKYLTEFKNQLITLKDEGLAVFDCGQTELGADWDDTIKKNLHEADYLVCLVSANFLNTDYIRRVEIEGAIEQMKPIIPIIVSDCDWESSRIGKYQAAKRGKILTLDNEAYLAGKFRITTEEERAAFWKSVIVEFRAKLF